MILTNETLIAGFVFLGLAGASLGALATYERLPAHHRADETYNLVRVIGNLFVVMTSLVLGLTINSAKNTFESIDDNVHVFATELILLDRSLRHYGPETGPARELLSIYLKGVTRDADADTRAYAIDDRRSEQLLTQAGREIDAIKPPDAQKMTVWQDVRQHYQKVVGLRWMLIEQSEGDIPRALLVMLVAWLLVIFASLGYRAPRNAAIGVTFVASAGLLAASIYLILDMEKPFAGAIQVSSAPLQRALAEIQAK
ncbi:hypothetical protein RB623_00295 [Mesorhizobium sp. LHD-90]|uniref:bestrophin-like domain n=1 Tax=Mesorhizobium sp. LHD-90 TaxID=3071414 RepID=UPI0027E04709|nr:hypothetical protein [Mesorhizobium sp. LHD-90]MDQ6432488.1 hypothetical protein [Mesorhizobium sp. LHD-90]